MYQAHTTAKFIMVTDPDRENTFCFHPRFLKFIL